MAGWHVSVHRLPEGASSPPEIGTALGAGLANWRAFIGGLRWLDDLVARGDALRLASHGYPTRYAALARHLLPTLVAGPAGAKPQWAYSPQGQLLKEPDGPGVLGAGEAACVDPDDWLIVEAWDES